MQLFSCEKVAVFIRIYNLVNDVLLRIVGFSPRDGRSPGLEEAVDLVGPPWARRYRVLLRTVPRSEPAVVNFLDNFALAHLSSREEPARAILGDRRASLMGITDRLAVFGVVPEGFDVHDPANGAFLREAQVRNAEEVVVTSLKTFVELGKSAGKTGARVLFLSSTARCGSTLLTQMLDRLDGVRAMSEPEFFTQVFHLQDKLSEPLEEVVKAGISLQCKDEQTRNGKDLKLIVFKPRSECTGLMPVMAQLLPDIKHAFMLRNPMDNIASIYNIVRVRQKMSSKKGNPWDWTYSASIAPLTPPGSSCKDAIKELFENISINYDDTRLAAFFWALRVHCFKECRDRLQIDVLPVDYEDVLKDPVKTISDILHHCKVSVDNLDDCLRAMTKDSQEKSIFNRKELSPLKRHACKFQEKTDVVDSILQKLNLPRSENYKTILKKYR